MANEADPLSKSSRSAASVLRIMDAAAGERDIRLAQFGGRIRLLRRRQGLSQEQLAHEAGLHRVTVGLIERAEREVGITTVVPLARALGVAPGDLFEEP